MDIAAASAYLSTLPAFLPGTSIDLAPTLGGTWRVESDGQTLGYVSSFVPSACRKAELKGHTAEEIAAGFYFRPTS